MKFYQIVPGASIKGNLGARLQSTMDRADVRGLRNIQRGENSQERLKLVQEESAAFLRKTPVLQVSLIHSVPADVLVAVKMRSFILAPEALAFRMTQRRIEAGSPRAPVTLCAVRAGAVMLRDLRVREWGRRQVRFYPFLIQHFSLYGRVMVRKYVYSFC